MPFGDRLHVGDFPLALEITPPKNAGTALLARRARLLGSLPSAINVIQRPGRQSSLDASIELCRLGLQPAWHLVTRGRSRSEIAADLDRAAAAGIEQVLVIRGDHDAPNGSDAITIRDTIALARAALPGALIGATMNQYAPDPSAVLRNLLPKLRAGATYVQTQPVFSLEGLRPLAERVKLAAPDARLVAMVMPLSTLEAADRVGMLGVSVPPETRQRIESGGDPWEAFGRLLTEMVESPLIDGLAVMTFETDPGEDVATRIVSAAARAGIH